MKDDLELESMLRELRPQKLPDDLRTRMQEPPARPSRWKRIIVPVSLAAAAAITFLLTIQSTSPPADESAAPITIVQQQSSLINSRVTAVIEHNGQTWELIEQEWVDEEVAVCSTTPTRVRLAVTRHELVYQPVTYY